jgi:hypothetical protein
MSNTIGGEKTAKWKGPVSWLFVLLIGGTILWFWTPILDYIWEQIDPPPETVVLEFQAELGCPSGDLTDIRKGVGKDTFALSNGADNLVICDTETLETTIEDLPADLAGRYQGCLEIEHSDPPILSLLRLSPHVCQVPEAPTLICNGAPARHKLDGNARGVGESPRPCTGAELTKFGFK